MCCTTRNKRRMATKREKPRLEPARSVIAKAGGPAAVAGITGKTRSTVYRWMWPIESGGTGGLIPSDDQQTILAYAIEHGLKIKPSDFFVVASRSCAA